MSDDLKKIIDNLTEEKNNIEIICNSFKERVRQLEKELSEVKLDNIKLAKQVEDHMQEFRNKGEL